MTSASPYVDSPFIPPHYRTLGLAPGASDEEIRAAYRRLAKKHHPDANPDDPASEELFKRVAGAYRILSDPSARRRYDRAAGVAPAARSSASKPASGAGKELLVRLFLTLEQAAAGGRRDIRFPRKIPCPQCRGLGEQAGRENCSSCNGSGIIKRQAAARVSYPAGVRGGRRLKFPGLGHQHTLDLAAGDLTVDIALKPHRCFDLAGADLRYRALIGLDLFIEGGRLRAPTLTGPVEIEVPPRIPDGRILKIPGRGLPACGSDPAGDLIVTVELCVPKRLSRKERQKLDELMTLPGFRAPRDEDGWTPKGD